jgi:hypothetical protein
VVFLRKNTVWDTAFEVIRSTMTDLTEGDGLRVRYEGYQGSWLAARENGIEDA